MLAFIQKHRDQPWYPHHVLNFEQLSLEAPVIFLTGENGSGKSTLLRLIHTLANTIDLGRSEQFSDATQTELHQNFTLGWHRHLKRGYYFQSEDFYRYLQWAKEESPVYEEYLEEIEAKHHNKQSLGYLLESELQKANKFQMDAIVEQMSHVSHGEGYLAFFKSRLREKTLYLLDEPETPLSFHNQLSFISLIHEYAKKGCQFIICTHSPILLSYPNALIYQIGDTIHELKA